MTERADTGFSLITLSDSEFVLEDRTQNICGMSVYDADGRRIGSVEDLYIDPRERAVRFLEVALLTELGRIGEPNTFGEAVGWALENHPSLEEAKFYVRRLRACTRRPDGAGSMGAGG